MKIIGYGLTTKGEAGRYMEATMKEFARLCDETVILCNNAGQEEKDLITKYGFKMVEDNREWGTNQHIIKQDLMQVLKTYNPTHAICLDMDEVFDPQVTRERLIELFDTGHALYFFFINLWNDGWNKKWSFWNIRAWTWSDDLTFEKKPLHCGLSPAWCYRYASYAPHFVKHYGLMKKEDRQKKIDRYNKYDPKAIYKVKAYYDALAEDKSESLDENWVRETITREVGKQKKRTIIQNKRKFYYVLSPQGKTLDIPERDLKETLARGFKLIKEVGK